MLDRATEEMLAALRHAPGDPGAWEAAATRLARLGRGRHALELLLEGSTHHPERESLLRRARRELLAQDGILGEPRLSHPGYVRAVAASPDGAWIASAGDDRGIRLWSGSSGLLVRELAGHGRTVRALAFSPDSRWLVSGSEDRTVRIWELATGSGTLVQGDHRKAVLGVAVSPDGTRFATASSDSFVRLFRLPDGAPLGRLGGSLTAVQCVAFSPDGGRLLSGSLARTLTVWDLSGMRALAHVTGHRGWIHACGFSPDGTRLVSGSQDETARIWSAATGEELVRIDGGSGPVHGCLFGADGTTVALAARDGSLRLVDADDGRERLRIAAHEGPAHCLGLGAGGTRWVSGGADGRVQVYAAGTGTRAFPELDSRAPLLGLGFLATGDLGLAASDGSVRIVDPETGEPTRRLGLAGVQPTRFAGGAGGAVLALGGVRSSSQAAGAVLWLADRPYAETLIELPGRVMAALAISESGTHLAAGSDTGHLAVFDPLSGAERARLETEGVPLRALAFAPGDGLVFASFEDGSVRTYAAGLGFALEKAVRLDAPADVLVPAPDRRAARRESVLAGCRDGRVLRLSSAGVEARGRSPVAESSITGLAARAGLVLVGTAESGVLLLEAGDLGLVHLVRPSRLPIRGVDLSADGRLAAYGAGAHAVLEPLPSGLGGSGGAGP